MFVYMPNSDNKAVPHTNTHTHTHTQPYYPITRVSRHQKGKTNLFLMPNQQRQSTEGKQFNLWSISIDHYSSVHIMWRAAMDEGKPKCNSL